MLTVSPSISPLSYRSIVISPDPVSILFTIGFSLVKIGCGIEVVTGFSFAGGNVIPGIFERLLFVTDTGVSFLAGEVLTGVFFGAGLLTGKDCFAAGLATGKRSF